MTTSKALVQISKIVLDMRHGEFRRTDENITNAVRDSAKLFHCTEGDILTAASVLLKEINHVIAK